MEKRRREPSLHWNRSKSPLRKKNRGEEGRPLLGTGQRVWPDTPCAPAELIVLAGASVKLIILAEKYRKADRGTVAYDRLGFPNRKCASRKELVPFAIFALPAVETK
jgi:hypothetical protein